MRIAIATPLYPPEVGGPATYAKLLAEGLPRHGIEVEIVNYGDLRRLPYGLRQLAYIWRVRRTLKNADLVLDTGTGILADIAARLARKPLIAKIAPDAGFEKNVAARAKQVIVPSSYLEETVAAWGIPKSRIKVICTAVSFEEGGVVPKAVERLSRPLIVATGRLLPEKHIDGVIDAIVQLRENGVPASLALVGEGPELARLVRHAEKKLTGGYFFTGALSHADTLATLASANAFVLNSSYEGLSHFLVEALMLGVPTVATAVGGNAEVITDGENGLLVPFGDTPMLVDALTRVLTDEKLRSHLALRAKESARHFSTETMLSSVAHLLQKTVGRGGIQPRARTL
jgi:glycosyltransferase involved in cell wall biosynthesis